MHNFNNIICFSHASANSYMDALAHHRASMGLNAISINWGQWGQVGKSHYDYSLKKTLCINIIFYKLKYRCCSKC